MRFVEGIRGKRLPVAPDLLENLRVVAVLDTTLDKLRFHRIDDILFLLTHGLTQSVTLTTGEVGQQARQQHHLLLIHRNTIGILQVFLHHRDIISDGLITVLTTDKLRDITHRSWTVKSVHGDKVLKHGRFQLAQVFLHTSRLKLEGTNGTSLLVEFKSFGIVDGNVIEVHLDAPCTFDILAGLLQLRQGLQAQEVHLDKSC